MLGVFRSLDVFPKVDPRYLRQTVQGGVATSAILCIVGMLFLSEFWKFLTPQTVQQFVVDRRVEELNIPIYLNLSVASSCENLVVSFANLATRTVVITDMLDLKPTTYRLNSTTTVTGCNLAGSFSVSRVPGSFSIIPRIRFQLGELGIVGLDLSGVDFSHTIHQLSFGAEYGEKPNMLDGTTRDTDGQQYSFQYFIYVVPTFYQDPFGAMISTNQYSVHDYARKGSIAHGGKVGIFVKYSIEPVSVHVTQKRHPALLLVQMMGILGGLFTLSGKVYSQVSSLVMAQ